MAQSPDSFTSMLGELPIILIVAALLAFPIFFLLLRLYRRAVLRSMDRQAGAAQDLSKSALPPEAEFQKSAAPLRIISLPESAGG